MPEERKIKIIKLIAKYKANLSNKNEFEQEVYKWQLVERFKGRPNLDAEDFAAEIKAMNYANLIYMMSKATLDEMAKAEPEEVGKIFRGLFDEEIDLLERIISFRVGCAVLYKKVNSNNNNSVHQSEREISVYLTYHYPEKYTFYKHDYYKQYCDYLGLNIEKKNQKFIHYLELIKELAEYVKADDELVVKVREMLPANAYEDENCLILSQDILYRMLNREEGKDMKNDDKKYWLYSPGGNAKHWDEFYKLGIMGLGFEPLGDIAQYKDKKEIQNKFQELEDTESSKKNDTTANYEFLKSISVGDVVIVKRGVGELLGWGIVTSDYYYDKKREYYKKCRKVDWKLKGKWQADHVLALKTLTDITDYPTNDERYEYYYERLLGLMESENQADVREEINAPLNQILYGPPGTGKTYHTIDEALKIVDPGFDIEQDRNIVKAEFKKYVDNGQIVFTTFHQSMSYEDFIEGIKPMPPEDSEAMYYDVIPGIFSKLCETASDSGGRYVLIIDEINRGNVSQIFGELITLIEEDKRKGKDEQLEVMLPYSKKPFSVPPNLYIIGTMNTADRSVEALDTALRRRFCFVEMPPRYDLDKLDYDVFGHKAGSILRVINSRLEKLLDKDHCIGHSYFILKNGADEEQAVIETFYRNIIPLMQEYFFGDFGKIGLVLGKGFVRKKEWKDNGSFAAFDHISISDFESRDVYEIIDHRFGNDSGIDFKEALNILMKGSVE